MNLTTFPELLNEVRAAVGDSDGTYATEERVRAWYMARAGGYEDITADDLREFAEELLAEEEAPIVIDAYTGNYQEAMRRSAPALGRKVRAHESCDAREWDDVRRLVRRSGRDLEFVDSDGDYNVYRVVRAQGEQD